MRYCSIWEMIRVFFISIKSGMLTAYGVWHLSKLKRPIITVFGGAGAYEEGKYAQLAQDFGKKCAEHNLSVITGGGPGIMQAAECGAYSKSKKNTLGIAVRGVDEEVVDVCGPLIRVDYFFSRKWLLTRYSSVFVLFPGGIGTMDEFFYVLNLVKHKQMDKLPIIFVGTNYWRSLIDWYTHAFEYEFITMPPQDAFTVTDDVDEVMKIILNSLKSPQ